MRSLVASVAVLSVASCGTTALTPGAGGAGGSDSGIGPTAHGVVLAEMIQGASSDSFQAYADFAPGRDPFAWNGPIGGQPTAGDCACLQGIPTPIGLAVPEPTIIKLTDAGGVVAEVDPFGVAATANATITMEQETWDLGSVWYAFPGGYPAIDASAWKAGDVLQVRGFGGSFSPLDGQVIAGARLTGVAPALTTDPLIISRDSDFTVSWTPDTLPGQTVLLAIRQAAPPLTACFCAQSDEAGTLALPASLVALYTSDPESCSLKLERLNVSVVETPAGPVQLVAAATIASTATVP